MVEIRVYGKLRKQVTGKAEGSVTILEFEANSGKTLMDAVQWAGIKIEDIYTIFLNGGIVATHNSMACFLGYRQACKGVDNWSFEMPVKDGDRIGIFGFDMAALVI